MLKTNRSGSGVRVITRLNSEADWYKDRIYFGELNVLTGLSRGYVQSLTLRGLWDFAGRKVEAGICQYYTFHDVFAIWMAAMLARCGFKVKEAWKIVREHVGVVIEQYGIEESDEEYRIELDTKGRTLVIPSGFFNEMIGSLRNGDAYEPKGRRVSLSPRDASRKRKEART
jgi:hypothetical protein